ncbi:MAG: SpoIIE family protein phosphatase [Anaerolineales bacterium]|nr:SpoIIE family protein phosphatase [Chloroflexota bacterium]MBL6983647.1 SpoIIE family protein phosphatase [Anaerolineales bacterium]
MPPQPRTRIPRRYRLLLAIARQFRSDIDEMQIERQIVAVGDIISFLYALPLAVVGIIWLTTQTDWSLFLDRPWELLLLTGLFFVFNYLRFFLIVELRANRYGSTDGSLAGIVLWSGMLLYGPTVFWLAVIGTLIEFITVRVNTTSPTAHWSQARNVALNLAGNTIVALTAYTLYQYFGGTFPLSTMSLEMLGMAFGLLLANFILLINLWLPYLVYATWSQRVLAGTEQLYSVLYFFYMAIGLPHLAHPFAILAAGLHTQSGIPAYLFFISGMLIVAFLSRQLSWSSENSRQQSRMLQNLERLGRAIIDAPPHTEDLPEILAEHLTLMFPAGRHVIWIFPEEELAKYPPDWKPNLEAIWPWLLDQTEGVTFLAHEPLPWNHGDSQHNPMVIAAIKDGETGQTFGGVYLELYALAQPWDRRALLNLLPAIQSLAAQIASATNQAKVYSQTLEYERLREELKLAGQIQNSLLPSVFPDMTGWQFAVTIYPAGETSGDFFDIINMENGRIGLVLADVLDKGIGPALFMTLSRTLLRTYALDFEFQPDIVLFATNERILKDSSANLFVTVFYGVLDPQEGTLIYANAGHNPPILLRSGDDASIDLLEKTGLPIGIEEETAWENRNIQINPGDVLVLYTDGIPEAQNGTGEFFRRQTLEKVINDNIGRSAEGLQQAILDALYEFLGDVPPQDDITLMVIKRDRLAEG